MTHFPHGAMVAIHAAREEEEKRKEEEMMTKYTADELEQNWEFKIVRSGTTGFRKPDVFHSLLAEEAIAGWELVEKLDDGRVRFKRRRDSRRMDATLPPGLDPYRTRYGAGTNARTMIGLILGLLAFMGFGLFYLLSVGSEGVFSGAPVILPAIIVLAGLMAGFLAFIRRR